MGVEAVTTDEKVHLAERIFDAIRKSSPKASGPKKKQAGGERGKFSTEWEKWSHYATRKGFREALQFAEKLKSYPALRSGPREHYRTIADVSRKFERELSPLSPLDLGEVLGYVRWLLRAEKL